MEIWKTTVESDRYEVSNNGKIRHIIRKQELKLNDNGNGYKFWTRYENGKLINSYVHRTVYSAFIELIPNGMTINHKNFDRGCNNLENLEICSLKENLNYSRKKGRFDNANKKQSEKLKINSPFKSLTSKHRKKAAKTRKNNWKPEKHGMYGKFGFENPNFKYNINEIKSILNLFDKGNSMLGISKILNIPYSQVYNFCKGKYKNILNEMD